MNIYLRELKTHRKVLFFWCIAMILLISSSMAKYATYTHAGQSMEQIVKQFPHAMQVIFGISGFNLSTATGYFGVIFLYIALMATAHAVLLGSEIIAKEERDRTSEFLFVRPITRSKVITTKLLAGLTNLVILNLVTYVSSLYFVYYFTKGQDFIGYVTLLMIATFFLQLIFFAIGTAIAGTIKRPKAAASLSATVLMVTLLLMFMINLNDKIDFLKYLTPFKYFDAKLILDSNALNPGYVLLSGLIIGATTYATYHFYTRRDLNV